MRIIFLFMVLLPVLATAQVCDDFESGNTGFWSFNEPGRWQADTTDPLNGMFSLRHAFDNSSSGTDMAVLKLDGLRPGLDDTRWSFKVRHGYNPSSSNNWGVILMSDLDPTKETSWADLSGFILGVNITGFDDSVRICYKSGGSYTTVVTLPVNWQHDVGPDNIASIVAERKKDGIWYATIVFSGNEYYASGNEPAGVMPQARYFGVRYKYTANYDRLLWFDDLCINGSFIADTLPPSISNAKFSGNRSIEITFTEPVSDEVTSLLRVETTGSGQPAFTPVHLRFINDKTVNAEFDEPFTNKTTYSIIIDTLTDLDGNIATGLEFRLIMVIPELGDLVISEIMPSPSPPVSLPGVEYIEIHNRTGYPFDSETFSLIVGKKDFFFTGCTFEADGRYIICCENDSALFSAYGATIPVSGSFSLPADGTLLCLVDSAGNLIHGIEYNRSWFNNLLKNEGGWSFEIIDEDFPFSPSGNWAYSTDSKGGTPGKANSQEGFKPDTDGPSLSRVFPVDNNTLEVSLSETIITGSKPIFRINDSGNMIRKTVFNDLLNREATVTLERNLNPGVTYSLSLADNLTDVAGNKPSRDGFLFGLPEEAGPGDIVFNEVLFNPLPYRSEYIEFYNRSAKTLDASRLVVFSYNSETGDTGMVCPLSQEGWCLVPNAYYAITKDREDVISSFSYVRAENIFEVSYMPVLDDREGTLILCNRLTDLIDRFDYSENMHNDILSSVEGISLERKDPERPTNEPGNWVSAASVSGWGTPGAPNSCYNPDIPDEAGIVLSSGRITPDGDGTDDLLEIGLLFRSDNMLVSANIFSDTGMAVKSLAQNETCSYDGKLTWDGTSDDGMQAAPGIYIVWVKAIDSNGRTWVWKKVCALTRR